MSFLVMTWNVNSVKARKDRLIALLGRHNPDVLCLQELKLTDEKFPLEEVKAAGYHAAVFGQKTYNGVAILSREEPKDVHRGFEDGGDDSHSRFIAATVRGVRIASAYFPNGGDPGSPKYEFKLEWMRRLRAFYDKHCSTRDSHILCGDFNVAPDDTDIAKPASWRDTVLANDTVRLQLEHVRAWGFVDAFKKHHPNGGVYSWWDYRQLGFPKNDGLRIDHIFTTPDLEKKCIAASVDREERKGKLPSDHAPVMCTFEL